MCVDGVCKGQPAGAPCVNDDVCHSGVCQLTNEYVSIRFGYKVGVCQGLPAGIPCEVGQCEPPLVCDTTQSTPVCVCPNCCLTSSVSQCATLSVQQTRVACCPASDVCCATGVVSFAVPVHRCCGKGTECVPDAVQPSVGTCEATRCPTCCHGDGKCGDVQNATGNCCETTERCCLQSTSAQLFAGNSAASNSSTRGTYMCCAGGSECVIDDAFNAACGQQQSAFLAAATRGVTEASVVTWWRRAAALGALCWLLLAALRPQ